MSTVVEPPRTPTQPQPDELEALIEEARQRQRNRRRRIGAAVVVGAALGGGVSAYFLGSGSTGGHNAVRTAPRAAASLGALKPEIVFAANRRAVAYGEIYRVDLNGHRIDLSRSPAADIAPAVSPNGKWVAFLSDRGGYAALYVVGIGGRPLRRLSPLLVRVFRGDGLEGRVVWSPDGSEIAYQVPDETETVHVSRLGGGATRRVPAQSLPWFGSSPPNRPRAAAPHGSWLASWRPLDANSSAQQWALKISRPGTSSVRTLVRTAPCGRDWGSPFASVQFTPSGRALVYGSFCAEPFAGLYAVRADGSHLRPLAQPRADLADPAISPDRRFIAFTRADTIPCKGCSPAIWVMDASGAHLRRLTSPRLVGEADSHPSWSPDGTRILFTRTDFTASDALYVVRREGGPARPLHVAAYTADWGPKKIAYLPESGPTAVVTIAPDGSGRRVVTRRRAISALAWSRDGRLAYIADHGSTIRVVGGSRMGFRLPVKAWALAWSPNGKRLLVSAARVQQPTELFVLDLRSGGLRPVTSRMGWVSGMSWR